MNGDKDRTSLILSEGSDEFSMFGSFNPILTGLHVVAGGGGENHAPPIPPFWS